MYLMKESVFILYLLWTPTYLTVHIAKIYIHLSLLLFLLKRTQELYCLTNAVEIFEFGASSTVVSRYFREAMSGFAGDVRTVRPGSRFIRKTDGTVRRGGFSRLTCRISAVKPMHNWCLGDQRRRGGALARPPAVAAAVAIATGTMLCSR